MGRYLIVFTHDAHWLDFRIAEIVSLFQYYSIDPNSISYWNSEALRFEQPHLTVHGGHGMGNGAYIGPLLQKETAFLILEIDLPNSDELLYNVCSRSVMIKAVYELWSFSYNNVTEVVADLVQSQTKYLNETNSSLSFSVEIDAFFRTLTPPQKQLYRDLLLEVLRLSGPVDLTNPQMLLTCYIDFSFNKYCTEEEFLTLERFPAYFGKLIARGGMKEAIKKYDLKKRIYLGPTSLDHSLAFILSNMAQAHKCDFALDPFVGTGSILIALSHLGAICSGTDIDIRVLRGEMHAGKKDESSRNSTSGQEAILPQQPKKKQKKQKEPKNHNRNIFANFDSYGLSRPELIRLDNHLCDKHYRFVDSDMKVDNGMFNCIVTDPPYGIRAGAKKSGKKDQVEYSLTPEQRVGHIPSTQNYAVEEVMLDLLHNAARLLVIGGKLVYLIPMTYDFVIEDLPQHPCLSIDWICEQPLSSRHCRRAVVLTKTCAYTPEKSEEFNNYKQRVAKREDGGFSLLLEKLERALATNAFENEAVVKRASNGCVRRKESKAKKIRLKQAKAAAATAAAEVEGSQVAMVVSAEDSDDDADDNDSEGDDEEFGDGGN